MADRTISIAYKVEGNDGGFKKLVANAKDMENAIGGIAERIKSNMVNVNQIAMGFSNLGNALNDITAICADLSKAYAVQEEAETKLETVMRQRMAASDEAIQGIKEYCSLQQELGVIGDEVQLAGAQQVATFLKSETALRTLIPAMNNLVAQQKGLNATSGDAVNIGNLLGKAMMGQTAALRRVGITFSEAEEAAVKYGTEEERAAALAKIITNNVGEMNTKLAQTQPGRLKQIENALGDIKEELGGAIKHMMPYVTGLNQIVMATTNLSKIWSGVTALGQAYKNLAAGMAGATAAANGLKLALMKTGIGAAAVLLGVFIAKLYEAATRINEVSAAAQTLNKIRQDAVAKAGEQIAKIEALVAAAKNEKLTLDERTRAIRQLNSIIPGYNAQLDKTTGKYRENTAALKDYISQLERQYEIEGAKDMLKSLTAERARLLIQQAKYDQMVKRKQQKYDDRRESVSSNFPVSPEAQAQAQFATAIGTASAANELHEALTLQEENAAALKSTNDAINAVKSVYANDIQRDAVNNPSGTPKSDPGRSAYNTQSTTASVTPAPPEGSLAAMRKELQELEKEIEINVDDSRLDELLDKKMKLQENIEIKVKTVEEKENDLRINANWSKTSKDFQQKIEDTIQPTLDVKLNLDLGEVPEEFQKIPAIVNNGVKSTARLQKTMQGLSQSISSVGSAFSSIGGAIEMPELNVAGTIAQAIANIIAGFASASAQSSSMGPWAWVAFTLAGVAEIAGVIASIKNMAKFADGGIVSGPTMALVGEYAGASSNPEVIAPLNKLRELIPAGSAGTVVLDHEIVIDGSKLKIVMRNTNRRDGINGKR